MIGGNGGNVRRSAQESGGELLINKNSGKFLTQNIMRSGRDSRPVKNTRGGGTAMGARWGETKTPRGGYPNSY